MSGHFPLADSPEETAGSAASGNTEPVASTGSLRDWLGIDVILSILDPGSGYTVVKADPETIRAMTASTSEESGTAAGTAATNAQAADPSGPADAGAVDPAPAAAAATAASAKNSSAAETGKSSAAAAPSADTGSTAIVEKKEEKAKEEEKKSPTKLQKKYIKAWEEWHMRDFPENFPLHNYNWKYLSYDESGLLRYEGDDDYMIRRGIDVSEFQGKIDWDKVREAGYDFVFVRVGHRTMHTGDLQRDNRAIKNLTRAKKAGLDVGAYVFSQAITEKEAREEAQLCLDVIKESGVELTLPLVFDPEIVVEDYEARINYISGKQFTDNALAFCETIEKAGYTPALYANCSTETDILDMSRLKDTIIWYADYSGIPETPYDFTFWQYSNLGWVDGIPETETDLNVWFIKK